MGVVVSSLRIKKIWFSSLNILFVGGLLQSSVLAEDRQGLLLNAGLAVISDSNISRTADEISDETAIFSPQLQFLSNVGQHQFVFDYQGDFAVFNDHSQYNYNNHDLKLDAIFDHSYRLNTEFTLGYQNKVEEPGSTNAATQLNSEFNQLTSKSVLAKLYYGTAASSGQIVLGLTHDQQRYTNNEQNFRDLDRNKFTGTFFYRMAPNTRLLIEASITANDYVVETQFANQSSNANIYLAGVEWKATAATSGTFKLGYLSTSYDDEQLNDLTGLSYLLNMFWQPNAYSKVIIGASRLTNESAQQDLGGYINTGYSLALEQAFTSLTTMTVIYEQDKLDYSSELNRIDKRKRIEVGLAHSARPWLDISLDVRHLTRNSEEVLFNFSSNMIELSITTNFE